MAQNTANIQGQDQENAEKAKGSKKRNLVAEFVTPFMETKLSDQNGGVFYDSVKKSKGAVKDEFLAYWKGKNEWNNLELGEKESLKNIEDAFFLNEAIRVGMEIESKRDTLLKILDRDFELNNVQKDAISKQIKNFSIDGLSKHLLYRTTRQEFIDGLFPKQTERPKEHDMLVQFEALFAKNNIPLSDSQKEGISRLLLSPHISEEDIEAAMPLFQELKTKQLLVRYFMPTISLAEMESMGILEKGQVQEYIRRSIKEKIIGQDFAIEDSLIDSIDARDVVIPTILLPESDLDKLLAGPGKKKIIKQIEDDNKQILKEFENGNTLGLSPDPKGKFLPAFQKKLTSLDIENPELFESGSFVRGKIKQKDGHIQSFHFAIVEIQDDPKKNKEDKGRGNRVFLKNILTSDGFVDKNWKKRATEGYSYDEVYALLSKTKKPEGAQIETQEALNTSIESGETKEKILRNDIESLVDLNAALDVIDTDGRKYQLEEGSGVQIGKPGSKNFWVFQVESIDKKANKIFLSNGQTREELTFQDFFQIFESAEGTRLSKIEGPDDFLQAIKLHSPKGKEFEKIIYDSERGIFIPEDMKGEKDYQGILQFGGETETITLHSGSGGGNMATWSTGEWIPGEAENKEKKIKATPGKYKPGACNYRAGWNALFAQFLELRATPIIPETPLTAPEKKNAQDQKMKSGLGKRFMGNPSLHDMFTGAKGLLDFVKNKLEHGSKLHSAKFQLALGKKLGFNETMMRELRNKVHGNTKELMEKAVKDLSSLPSPERQKEVKNILTNKGSHDYEIQAAILAMLKKHGNLYVGSLREYEGTFIYFERLSGTKYSPDNPHVQRAMKASKEKGILFREEFLIENYLQFIGGEKGGYQVDWNLWLEVKKGWLEGISGETESGEKQAGSFGTLQGRLNFVYEKLEGGEYATGIGAMKKVWSKGGPGYKMHEPAIYLALSNIPNRLHGSQLDAIKNEFYGSAHPYPALTAMFTPEKLKVFQDTVKILCGENKEMCDAYKAVENARGENTEKSMKAIKTFWEKFGPEIHKKLIISQDPEILFRANNEPNKDKKETLQSYVANYKGDTESMGEFNKDELAEGVYKYDHSGYVWSLDAYLKNARVDRGPGTIGDDKGTVTMWQGYLDSLDAVKKIQVSTEEKQNTQFQFERFREHHKAFYKSILQKVGADWNDVDKETGMRKIEKHTYMNELKQRGFSVPLWRDPSKLETEEYDAIVRKDFQNYIKGVGVKTVHSEKEAVITSIHDIL